MADWEDNGFTYYFDIENNEACILHINNKNKKSKIKIPAKVQYNGQVYPVTKIRGWVYTSAKIRQVTDKRRKDYGMFEPTGEYYRFDAPVLECKDYTNYCVKSVVLPKSLKEIGDRAFTNCKVLTHVDIPEGVERIGKKAFYGCAELKELTIPSSVKEIGEECFALTSISLKIKNKPGSIKFGEHALGSDDKVTYVGKSLFSKLFG